jgi:hypothetical protein
LEGIRMKKEIILAAAAFFLMSLTAITGVYAIEEKEKVVTISETEADITGDGTNEKITLKGVPYADEDSYLADIFLEVSTVNNKSYKIELEGGTKAAFELVDLNHDGIKEIYANVLKEGNEGITDHFLYSLKDYTLQNLLLPEPVEAESRFVNGYMAEIILKPTGKRFIFDLKDRKKYYSKLGLYRHGKLNEPTELTVNPFSSLQTLSLNNGEDGLVGVQRVTGIANADTIAYIKTYWLYKNGKWEFMRADVEKEGEKP